MKKIFKNQACIPMSRASRCSKMKIKIDLWFGDMVLTIDLVKGNVSGVTGVKAC